MSAFVCGLLIGFIMCIPVGPINVWVVNTFIRKGAGQALAIAAGGSLMDLIYFLVIMTGLSFFNFNDEYTLYMKSVGILIILLLGIKEIFTKNIDLIEVKKSSSKRDLVGAFVIGVVLYTSNPTLIITMTGVGAFIKSLTLFPLSTINNVLVSFGLSIGTFLWFLFLTKVVGRYEGYLTGQKLTIFSKISGYLMVGIAIFMGSKLML